MRKILATFFLLLGFLALAKPSYHYLKRNYLYLQSRGEWQGWKSELRESKAGDPVAWLKAGTGDLNYLVRRGTDPKTLLESPGLSEAGGLPEEPGLKVILAHRDIHFKNLWALKVGSRLQLESTKATNTYKVVDTEILSPEKTELKLQEARQENRLALVTCYPFQYIGAAPQRYIVWAAPEDPNHEKKNFSD